MMKKIIGILLALFLVAVVFATEKQIVVRVSNPLNADRPGELVTVKWSALQKALPSLKAGTVAVLEKGSTQPIVSQVIDYDQDGKPEELVFQSSFKAKETKEFEVKPSGGEATQVVSLTYAGFMVPREDLAWENDRIAF